MPKKKLSILLVLAVLLIHGGPAGKSLADAASELQQAETQVKRGEYAAAEQIYVRIAAEQAGTEDALDRGCILSCGAVLRVGLPRNPDEVVAFLAPQSVDPTEPFSIA